MDRWREHVANADPDVFRTRLDREGLDEQTCRNRIDDGGWPSNEPLPAWIDRLEALLQYVHESSPSDYAISVDEELPFVDILLPVLAFAREGIEPVSTECVTADAVEDLIEILANRLSKLWSHTVFIEFKTHIAERDPDLVFDDGDVKPDSIEHYEEFCDRMLRDELAAFFVEYAFLGRLVVSVIDQWKNWVGELCDHVTRDRERLNKRFGSETALGPVVEIDAMGDPHHGGRRVLSVTFQSGTTVAYKPRNSDIVAGFYDLLDWINRTGDLLHLETLEVLPRETYAWIEWVEPRTCGSETEVRNYYRRAGMLIAVFYALDATDMHLENIVAVGDQPVAIDVETLAQPMVKPQNRSVNEAIEVAKDTVVRTGAVPEHVQSPDVDDVAGFSAKQLEVNITVDRFTDVNTDRMDIESVPHPNREGESLPQYSGEVIEPEEYSGAIVRGFVDVYELFMANEGALLSDDGPIEQLIEREPKVRALYRDTAVYTKINRSVTSHSYHRTGLRFGTQVESLAKLLISGELDRDVWPIFECERSILRRFNTPRFTAKIDSTDIFNRNGTVVEDFFESKVSDQIRDRIRGFSKADLDEQVTYLRWGYGEYEQIHGGGSTATLSATELATGEPIDGLVLEESRRLYDRLISHSRRDDGLPTWVLREVMQESGIYIHPVEDNLYSGRLGIGLFAAGLARLDDDESYRDFALDVVSPVMTRLEDDISPPFPIGGGVGLGSMVYGFTKLGELLADDACIAAASEAARRIDSERIAADNRYDVLHGSAGAILGLLALYEVTGEEDILDRAVQAGDHLLNHRHDHQGVLTWSTPSIGRPLCGFAHGVAGIAYALFRLGSTTDAARFSDAALEGIRFERQQYDHQAQNWPDLRPNTETDWMDAWCHGRTGIGLARLGMYEIEQIPELRRDVDRALQGIETNELYAADHLCCGNFGRIEFLRRAARTLDEPTHLVDAKRLAAASVERATSSGQFSTPWQTEHWYNPSFFTGETGIGYSLMQFAAPSLPCAVLWE
ncbi:hypothetical protein B1756_14695 [Natrarchaeobaculum aegyptiacum]|uniref:Lantibiotic biosynthesis protein dehydration domain-containing protein n=2 Tax=Natrarchaeobaculum aegyptiacum TaxID=745377 RepID=A0A2Z2I2A6_9EURY|nr:hypothetical protein B1756_14695 [Natrarchaeobaculum aegyptiacum]